MILTLGLICWAVFFLCIALSYIVPPLRRDRFD